MRLGRIYRVVHESTEARRASRRCRSSRPRRSSSCCRTRTAGGATRRSACSSSAAIASVAPALAALVGARTANEPRTRLHALWTLEGLGALDAALVTEVLGDPSPHVRAAAVRLSEPMAARARASAARRGSVAALDDSSAIVRRQAAASVGELPEGPRELAIGAVLERRGDDPVAVDAALSGARGREVVLLDRLLRGSAERRLACGRWWRCWRARSSRAGRRRRFNRWCVGGRARLVRRGSVTRCCAAPSQDCRAPAGWRRCSRLARGGGGGAGAPRITLDATPRALVALVAGRATWAPARARLLDALRLAGEARAWRPRCGAADRRSAEAFRGRAGGLSQPLCRVSPGRRDRARRARAAARRLEVGGRTRRSDGAHRPEREGEHDADAAARRARCTDQQIADVLTYVRRSWGHTATPVDVGLVREVRGASTGRDRPWTEAELLKVTQPDGIPRGAMPRP